MPDRSKVQRSFTRALQSEFATQRRELVDSLSESLTPPDSSYWAEKQRSVEDALVRSYEKAYVEFSKESVPQDFVRSQAAEMAEKMIQNTKVRVERKIELFNEKEKRPSKKELNAELNKVVGKGRAKTIGTTEAVKVETKAKKDEIKAEGGGVGEDAPGPVLIWRLRPCRHCKFCPLMHGLPEDVFARWLPGPPAHPNCCCQLEIKHFKTQKQKDAFIAKALDRVSSHGDIVKAAKESGVAIF